MTTLLTDEQIIAIGHRNAFRYRHGAADGGPGYIFDNHTLVLFAKAIIEQAVLGCSAQGEKENGK